MPQYAFGSGSLFGFRTDQTPATPVKFGALQGITIDFAFTLKELHGQFQFPIAIGRGTAKITGKAKLAQINGLVLNNLFFGQSQSSGQQLTVLNEAGTVPAGTPYNVTVANASGFATDLGVTYATTGLPLTKVASAPAVGQYSVTTGGIYSFAAADASTAMLLSYAYAATGSGNKATITNQLLGAAPTFQANFFEVYGGKQVNLQLNQCVAQKLSFGTKLDDFTVPEFDFMAFADASGSIGALSLAE